MGYTWVIHKVCDENFIPGMCDAHTHGLNEYGSKEIQFVLNFNDTYIAYLLNEVGTRVAEGLKLKHGMIIDGLFDDGAAIKVYETKDSFGEPIFRLIMQDEKFKYPEESEEYPYSLQYMQPYVGTLN